jgi:phosphatidylglycerophosphatase A
MSQTSLHHSQLNRLNPWNLAAGGLGSGYIPYASGTTGSLAAVALWAGLGSLGVISNGFHTALCAVIITVFGLFVTHKALQLHQHGSDLTNVAADRRSHKRLHDPGFIVIDEWAGMLFSLIPVSVGDYSFAIVAFIAFRIMDVLKPGPIGWAEKLPGTWGIMLDDCFAGIIVAILLEGARRTLLI